MSLAASAIRIGGFWQKIIANKSSLRETRRHKASVLARRALVLACIATNRSCSYNCSASCRGENGRKCGQKDTPLIVKNS